GEVGGPIIKDKLWFYAGFLMARTAYNLDRALNITKSGESSASRQRYEASKEEAQAFAKLTWAAGSRDRISFSIYTLPSTSGGSNRIQMDPLQGVPAVGNITGTPDSLFNQVNTNTTSLQAD